MLCHLSVKEELMGLPKAGHIQMAHRSRVI